MIGMITHRKVLICDEMGSFEEDDVHHVEATATVFEEAINRACLTMHGCTPIARVLSLQANQDDRIQLQLQLYSIQFETKTKKKGQEFRINIQ